MKSAENGISIASLTPKTESIAKAYAAPFILRLLRPFTADSLKEAIETNLRLVDKLIDNPQYLNTLKFTCLIIPFIGDGIIHKALPNIRDKEWIRWFLENECKMKRNDFYKIFMFTPNGWKWLVKNLEELSRYLEENL